MEQLKVTLIQSHLHWENPVANREHFSNLFDTIEEETDLIVLPEMFTSGFTMNAQAIAENVSGPTLKWMQFEAKNRNAAITGSFISEENSSYYNRLFFVLPDGSFEYYDKRHSFTLGGEDKIFTAGSIKKIIPYKDWKICPLICYDLRFPVWSRNTELYDVLLYSANWPNKRINAWDALLKARAIENMSYCIGVNRIGLDGNGLEYTGHTAAYDVLGTQISSSDLETTFVETITLSKKHIETHRTHLQFLNDRDHFTLK